MNLHTTEHRKPQYPHLAKERRDRLKKILELDAPETIVIMMAEHYLSSFKVSFHGLWFWLRVYKLPRWFLWLTDADYRQACREYTEDNFRNDIGGSDGIE